MANNLANVKHLYSPKMIRLPRRITEKVGPFKWLRISYEFLRISYEAYDKFAEFLVNPLRMLRLLRGRSQLSTFMY